MTLRHISEVVMSMTADEREILRSAHSSNCGDEMMKEKIAKIEIRLEKLVKIRYFPKSAINCIKMINIKQFIYSNSVSRPNCIFHRGSARCMENFDSSRISPERVGDKIGPTHIRCFGKEYRCDRQ